MNHLSLTFPLDVIICDRFVLVQSVSPQTLSNYAAGLIKFMQFCDDFDIPETARMPAAEPFLCIFITAHGAGKVGKGTLTSWLTGLKLWHTINGAPWLGKAHLSRAVKGATSFAPPSSTRPPRLPVMIDHLRTMKSNIQLSNPFDAAVWAIACIAFWSQCRLIELCVDGLFNPTQHAPKSTPLKSRKTSTGVEYGGFFSPSTKTKRTGEWICWTDSRCTCSTLTAFANHRKQNFHTPGHAPLFAYAMPDGSWAPMKWSSFMDRCNEAWHSPFSMPMTGHSFRLGGTTHLLLLSVDPFIVMVQGRWKSNALLTYWRNCEQVLPLFIGTALQSPHLLLSTMRIFKRKMLTH